MTAMSIDEQLTTELPWLRRLARELATEDADDLVHETWLLARRDRPEPRGRGGLRSWLAQAMRHRWFSIRRADISRSQREQRALAAPAEPEPEQWAIEADVARILDEALATLAAEDRALLRDRFFDGRTAAEIARGLGVPSATVRSRIHRSLGRLRRVLDERHGSDRSAWAPAFAVVPLRDTTTLKTGLTMATAIKGVLVVGALAGVAMLSWSLADRGESDASRAAVPAASPDASAPSLNALAPAETATPSTMASDLQVARERWTERRGAIEEAQRERLRAGDEPDVPRSDLPPPADLVPQLAQLGCVDRLPDHPKGRLRVRLHYIGEPDVGTVVESVEIVEDTLNAPEFTECWSNSIYMLDLDAPDAPVAGAYVLGYEAGDGKHIEQALGRLKAFVRENPHYAEEHEELGRLLELPDDTPANQWMPVFVEVVGRDPELDAALDALGKEAPP